MSDEALGKHDPGPLLGEELMLLPEKWFLRLYYDYRSNTKKFFVLDGNIRDLLLIPLCRHENPREVVKHKEFFNMKSYLSHQLLNMKAEKECFRAVVFYSLTQGFYVLENKSDTEKYFKEKKLRYPGANPLSGWSMPCPP